MIISEAHRNFKWKASSEDPKYKCENATTKYYIQRVSEPCMFLVLVCTARSIVDISCVHSYSFMFTEFLICKCTLSWHVDGITLD